MPGEKGEIIQSKEGNGDAIYLSDVVRIFKTSDDRIRFSTKKLIASINKDGSVTCGKRLYKILDTLYKREDKRK